MIKNVHSYVDIYIREVHSSQNIILGGLARCIVLVFSTITISFISIEPSLGKLSNLKISSCLLFILIPP